MPHGLVKRRRMHNDINPVHTAADEVGVGNGSDVRRKRRDKQVESDDFAVTRIKCPDERLTEMAGASCDKNPHRID